MIRHSTKFQVIGAQFGSPGPEVPLEFSDILPENPKSYDKMEPPKQQGSYHFRFVFLSN